MPRMFCSCLAHLPRMPRLPRWPYLVQHVHVCSALPPKGDLSIGMKGILVLEGKLVVKVDWVTNAGVWCLFPICHCMSTSLSVAITKLQWLHLT